MGNQLLAFVKAISVVACISVMMVPIVICHHLGAMRRKHIIIRHTYRILAFILGIRITVSGAPDTQRPLLLVTNHISYSDVVILGAITPLCFTPKAEVAGWAVIGSICRITGCVFIDRNRHKTRENQSNLMKALKRGNCICLFPEATTGTGLEMLPFHSSYFSLAQENINGGKLAVQPAAIRYVAVNGKDFSHDNYRQIAWIGDDEFFPHFWKFLALRRVDVSVTFFPTTNIKEHGDRKKLAAFCAGQIKKDALPKQGVPNNGG